MGDKLKNKFPTLAQINGTNSDSALFKLLYKSKKAGPGFLTKVKNIRMNILDEDLANIIYTKSQAGSKIMGFARDGYYDSFFKINRRRKLLAEKNKALIKQLKANNTSRKIIKK
jgi:hypothetical protein